MFLLENAEFTKRLLLREYTGFVNNHRARNSATVNWNTPYWILPSLFLPQKKSAPRFCRLLKDRSLKKKGKTPSSHIIHSLGGEYCWIVRDSEPIRLLKSPRSLSVYILTTYIELFDKNTFYCIYIASLVYLVYNIATIEYSPNQIQ